MGSWYSIEIYWKKFKKRYVKTVIYDSMKLMNFSVDKISKDFLGEEVKKLEIDYKLPRPKGYKMTDQEREYIQNDCIIVGKALKEIFAMGLNNMTIGSCALAEFKKTCSREFRNWFPLLNIEIDKIIRKAYKGGFTYLQPKYTNKGVSGCVFDVNSLYPSVMYYSKLPIGSPVYYEGEYQEDKYYPLYITHIQCSFRLKKGYLPTIQLKNDFRFMATEYITSSKDAIIDMYLTSVDLKLFMEHYHIDYISYVCGFKFAECQNVFKEYIDKWYEVKNTCTGAKKATAKLMLNSLYGKFATNPERQTKIPYYDWDTEMVDFTLSDIEVGDPVYTPMGAFITAWARDKTIRSAQSLYDRFIYADTDSLHLEGLEIPTEIDVDQKRLGAWKHESSFSKGVFIRAKTYMEQDIDGNIDVKCAGMPKNVKGQVTFDNFKIGSSFGGKLQPKRTIGGVVLEEVDFTIKK